MSHHQRIRELPQVGRIATALFNIPVMAAALAACFLALWLAQPETPPASGAAASSGAIAVLEPGAMDESTSPAR